MGICGGCLKLVFDVFVGIKGLDGNLDECIFSGKEVLIWFYGWEVRFGDYFWYLVEY